MSAKKKLIHYSGHPFHFDPTKKYKQDNLILPKGLWLSDESNYGWKRHCNENDLHPEKFGHETVFNLTMQDVLHFKSRNDLLKFESSYKNIENDRKDWSEVSQDYKGILISPYFFEDFKDDDYELRMIRWYSAWDCSSACIWDLSCLSLEAPRPSCRI